MMMGGMGGMGGMGMHPGYMQAMQQQQQQMMMGKAAQKKVKKRKIPGEGSGSDSSSDSSSDDQPAFDPRAAMAAAMMAQGNPGGWPASASAGPTQGGRDFKPPPGGSHPPPPPPPPPPAGFGGGGGDGDLEAFIAANPVNPEAIDRLRSLPPNLQAAVMRRGHVMYERNPSQCLIIRCRDAEQGGGDDAGARKGPNEGQSEMPWRKSAKASIEKMIEDYRLDIMCAWTMRALAPDKQKLAAKIDPSGQADPSGYVAEQLKTIV